MKNNLRSLRLVSTCMLICVALSTAALAKDSDRTHVGQSITVGPDEEVSEATCFGCSIHVRGHVTGDVTAFGGSIVIEGQGQVNGDATVFGGDIRLDKDVKVAGDVAVFGGRVRRDPAASVGGEITNMSGAGWIVLIFLLPLVVLGAFIVLVVWLIRRILRPSVPVTA
jgi:cytoskeletal protein CcmA (bactofilin family)